MEIHFNPPIHPGEMLREEFMAPLGLSAGRLAKALGVPRTRIERLVREETALTADTAIRLGRYFRTTERYWLNMQAGYEADRVHADLERMRAIDAIVPFPRPDLDQPIPEAEAPHDAAA